MKKLFAITLLAVHLFNFAGYAIAFRYLMGQSDATLAQKLDADNYNAEDLLLIKTPLHLPYYNASGGEERVNGEIEISGTHYTYVKRKVRNDTLYLYCIPNADKTKLSRAQSDYSRSVADTQQDNKKKRQLLTEESEMGRRIRH